MADNGNTSLEARLATALTGQYTLIRTLGQGGMGTVFLARDVTLDREVAIKVISSDVSANPEARERFIKEARTVAKLRHPNIVAVYTAGEGNGLLYFVMEFVPGESLRDRMTREPVLAVDVALPILHDLAGALDYAHTAGVVHRDVKPENVLLDRESGRAMLTDFGVAVALAAAAADDSRLTGVGFVLGSPRYMSPEQAAGERSLDGRSDLYSLGLIGYEMLSGAPAIDAPTAASTLVKQLTERPDPLCQKAPATPPEVGAAIDRVLEKNPADRFARGAEFAAALLGEGFAARTTSGRTSGARVAGARAPGARGADVLVATGKPRRLAWIVGGALALVAVIGGALFMRKPAGNTSRYFIAPFAVQGPDRALEWLHEGSVNMLTLALSQWTDLSVVEYERALDLLRDSGLGEKSNIGLEEARKVARKAGAGTVIMGTVTGTADSLQVVARLYSVESGRKLDERTQSARAGTDPRGVFQSIANDLLHLAGGPSATLELTKATTSSLDAYRAYLDGVRALNGWRLDAADSLLKRATDIDSTFALAYYKRALTLGWINRADRTPHVAASQKAVDYKDRLPKRLQDIVIANNDLAHAFILEGPAARASFEAAITRLTALVKTDSLDAEAWYGLADAEYHEALQTTIKGADTVTMLLTRSQRGFKRAIALDSTNHLAYQHLVGIYQMAAVSNSAIVLDGDSLRVLGTVDAVRAFGGQARVVAQKEVAKRMGLDAAAGWLAADRDAAQAYRSLSDSYMQLHKPDSAIAVLERAAARPATSSPVTLYRIALLQQVANDPRAVATLRAALQKYPADSLKARGELDRTGTLLAAITIPGSTGSLALLDTLARTIAATDSVLPGSAIPASVAGSAFAMSVRMGMGVPVSDADRKTILRGIELAGKEPPAVRQASISLPYMAFLATHDKTFADVAKSWSPSTAAAPYPELDALIALARGDTAKAVQAVATFPSADSIGRGVIGMAGLRVYARAEAAAGIGDARKAVALYEAVDPSRFADINVGEPGYAMYVRSFLARARLYEQLGETDKAIKAYEEFATRWKDADAPLQGQVREARSAAARLRDNPKAVPVRTGRGT